MTLAKKPTTNQPTTHPPTQPTNQPTNQPINQLTNQPNKQTKHSTTNKSFNETNEQVILLCNISGQEQYIFCYFAHLVRAWAGKERFRSDW